MLVLARRNGESIIIGEDIRVRIISVRGDVVRLGIDAPKDVEIDREEIRVDKESKRIDKTRR